MLCRFYLWRTSTLSVKRKSTQDDGNYVVPTARSGHPSRKQNSQNHHLAHLSKFNNLVRCGCVVVVSLEALHELEFSGVLCGVLIQHI